MKKLFTALLTVLSVGAMAQDVTLAKTKYRKTMPVVFEVSAGINNSKFIDFGTSPLYYRGSLITFMGAIRKETAKREVFFSLRYSTGSYSMNYNDIETASKLNLIGNSSIRYTRLYQINVMKSEKWNLKAGGTVDFTADFRSNPALLNNGLGYELFTTLMASGKISRDISNTEMKKMWFLKFKPKMRKLSYQLDLALINGNLRNGYIFSNSTPVYNDASFFKQYEYNIFSGYRMGSRLDYEQAVFGNNTLKFSYVWDAMMSGKDGQDRFQLVNNMLLVSLNIKLR
jgi:hypothetical protein